MIRIQVNKFGGNLYSEGFQTRKVLLKYYLRARRTFEIKLRIFWDTSVTFNKNFVEILLSPFLLNFQEAKNMATEMILATEMVATEMRKDST